MHQSSVDDEEKDTEKSLSPDLLISTSGDLSDYNIESIVQDIKKRNKLGDVKKSRKALRRYIIQDIPRTFYKLELFLAPDSEAYQQLLLILEAVALYRPDIGYVCPFFPTKSKECHFWRVCFFCIWT
eukprot:TRINITY_DN772_c0_g2_i2.p1 TRINITY_DN772_c0_g2~~TRINITY_DN772_c0_g2_i2.p1  ORF type:complete len:127 (-),score=15.77 TRINITY_DN772_c0_g2_i2:662-1042(-)